MPPTAPANTLARPIVVSSERGGSRGAAPPAKRGGGGEARGARAEVAGGGIGAGDDGVAYGQRHLGNDENDERGGERPRAGQGQRGHLGADAQAGKHAGGPEGAAGPGAQRKHRRRGGEVPP